MIGADLFDAYSNHVDVLICRYVDAFDTVWCAQFRANLSDYLRDIICINFGHPQIKFL